MTLQSLSLPVDEEGRRLAWTEWGGSNHRALVLCVPGLTRSGQDFDRLGEALAGDFRVACVDNAGRGRSDPLPGGRYGFSTYVADIVRLLEHLQPEVLHWVGTSMGGHVGLRYIAAAVPGSPPVRRLVLNDIGPEIPRDAIDRIGLYVGRSWRFPDLDAAEDHVRKVYAPFALRTDDDWRWFTSVSVRPARDGGLEPAFDPAIGEGFSKAGVPDSIDLWALWDSLAIPVLILQGEHSDVLPDSVASAMEERGKRAERLVVPGTGHAPSLLYPDQIDAVREFLLRSRR